MKKIIMAIVCLISMTMLHGQGLVRVDTVNAQHFDSAYVNWLNEDPHHSAAMFNCHIPGSFAHLIGDVVQRYYTDDDLSIVGIVGYPRHPSRLELNMTNYFLLYDAISDSFPLLGMLPWQFTDSINTGDRPIMQRLGSNCDCNETLRDTQSYRQYIERYFDTPIVVKDSFYVGGTRRGEVPRIQGETYLDDWYEYNCITSYSDSIYLNPDNTCERPPILWKVYSMDPTAFSTQYGLRYLDWTYMETHQYLLILPIVRRLDTTYYLPECERPANVHIDTISGDSTTIAWNGMGRYEWQVAYGEQGMLPDDCTIVTCTDSTWTYIDSRHDGLEMQVCVRTVCRDDDSLRYSPWSYRVVWTNSNEPISILLPEDDELNQYVHLMPNPAQDKVTVLSSFSLKRVEAYSLTGKQYMDQTAKGVSDTFDVSSWPKGMYLITVTTDGGTSTQKLVVE